MVKRRHDEIVEVTFDNPRRPRSAVEVLRLSTILARTSSEQVSSVQRLEFHLVALYVAGRTTHVVDFEDHPCRPGTVMHVRPGQVQRWAVGTSVEARLLLFTPRFISPQRGRVGAFLEEAALPTATHLEERDRSAAVEWFDRLEEIYDEADDSPLTSQLLGHVVAATLLDLARRAGLGRVANTDDVDAERMRRFRADLDRSFRVTRAVQDYSDRLGCSARTLDRTCRAQTGLAAKSFIDRRVVLEAERLLAHTTSPISEIADEVGFTESTNFIKFFKARTGMLPGAFRVSQREPDRER